MEKEYINPSKKSPVFVATCSGFGYITRGIYKDWIIRNEHGGGNAGNTFAIRYADAVNELHQWIIENKWAVEDYPACKFEIRVVNGSQNKFNEVIMPVVYSITASKAKTFLL